MFQMKMCIGAEEETESCLRPCTIMSKKQLQTCIACQLVETGCHFCLPSWECSLKFLLCGRGDGSVGKVRGM